MRHLLDTSALCAHFLREPGSDEVAGLLADDPAELGVCVVSWFEMRYALKRCGVSRADLQRALALYRDLPLESCLVADPVVDRAAELRDATSTRLPLADALIAGCAAAHDAILVHRDAHLDAVPDRLVRKHRLPDGAGGPPSRSGPALVKETGATYEKRSRGRRQTSEVRTDRKQVATLGKNKKETTR